MPCKGSGSSPRNLFAWVVAGVLTATASAFAQSPDDGPNEGGRLMVFADFNGDGIADIAEVSPAGDAAGQAMLTVSLGRADGSYAPMGEKVALGQKPESLVTADFNHDGSADVIVGSEDGRVSLFVGDGKGTLTAAGEIVRLRSVNSIVAGDFNHDGIPDLAIADPVSSSVTVMLGSGGGKFRTEWSFAMRSPGTSPHLSSADYNGDGFLDLAVVYDSPDGDTYDVLLGDGQGHFVQDPKYSLVPDPYAHCVTTS